MFLYVCVLWHIHCYLLANNKNMRMKNLFQSSIVLAGALLVMSSCGDNAATNTSAENSPKSYSDNIEKIMSEVETETLEAEQQIIQFGKASNFDSIVVVAGVVESRIEDKISAIKKLDEPKADGVNALKDETVNYLGEVKSLYGLYKKVAEANNDEKKQDELTIDLNKQMQKIDSLTPLHNAAQTEFAKKNNFTFEG